MSIILHRPTGRFHQGASLPRQESDFVDDQGRAVEGVAETLESDAATRLLRALCVERLEVAARRWVFEGALRDLPAPGDATAVELSELSARALFRLAVQLSATEQEAPFENAENVAALLPSALLGQRLARWLRLAGQQRALQTASSELLVALHEGRAWMRDALRCCWWTELARPGAALFSRPAQAERVTDAPLAAAVGHRLLRSVSAAVDIDPGSDHPAVIDAEQLPNWQRAAVAQGVLCRGRALAMGVGTQSDLEALRSHGRWHVVLRTEPRRQLAMAPDAQQRRLAAVFTEADTAQRFVARLSGAHVVEPVEAAALFSQLASLPLEGLVLDCTEPDAVALAAPVLAMLA